MNSSQPSSSQHTPLSRPGGQSSQSQAASSSGTPSSNNKSSHRHGGPNQVHSSSNHHPQQQRPTSSSSSKPGSSSSSSSSPAAAVVSHHNEDRLKRSWRGIASTVVVAATKAEKVAADPTLPAPRKELDDAVVALLRGRRDFSTLITYLECKLLGTEEEANVLQSYYACQPKVASSRTRKRTRDNDEEGGLPEVSHTAKAAQEDDIPLQPLESS